MKERRGGGGERETMERVLQVGFASEQLNMSL